MSLTVVQLLLIILQVLLDLDTTLHRTSYFHKLWDRCNPVISRLRWLLVTI